MGELRDIESIRLSSKIMSAEKRQVLAVKEVGMSR